MHDDLIRRAEAVADANPQSPYTPLIRDMLAALKAQSNNKTHPTFVIGQEVEKVSGSEWTGRIVGTYSTKLTPEGYAVESIAHAGSVQIYPAKALRACEAQQAGPVVDNGLPRTAKEVADAFVDGMPLYDSPPEQPAPKDCRTCENRYACANPVDREQIGCVNGDKYENCVTVQLWRRT